MCRDIGIIISDQSDRVCRHRILYHTKAIETTSGPALADSRFALSVSDYFPRFCVRTTGVPYRNHCAVSFLGNSSCRYSEISRRKIW